MQRKKKKKISYFWAGEVAQVEEYLPRKCELPEFKPSTAKKKKKPKKQEKRDFSISS
jgi:hypothetical protein